MYIQVVMYGLGGIDESEYLDVANELAPRFSGTAGLQAKIWLEDPDQGRYGAIYFWDDRESMERFLRSDLFEGTNPDFLDVESQGFSVLENLTAQTQPVLEVIEPRRQHRAVGRPPQKAVAKKATTARAVMAGGAGKAAVSRKAGSAEAASTKGAAKAATARKGPATKGAAKKATKKSAG